MKQTILVLMLAFLVGCGQDTVTGLQGPKGDKGDQGDPGPSVSGSEISMIVGASRDYDPSVFSPEDYDVEAGVYQLPDTIDLIAGVAGTGWVTVKLNGVRYCYQGDGKNNSDAGTSFEYSHAEDLDTGNCTNGTSGSITVDKSFIAVLGDTVMTVDLNGGGVSSSIRTFTEVEFTLDGYSFP